HYSLHRVTADAAKQRTLLLLRAGNTDEPLSICKLGCESLGLCESQIRRGAFPRANFRRSTSIQLVPSCPNAENILTPSQFRRRKTISAFLIGDDGDCNRRTGFLCADQNTFHGTFFYRAHLTTQRYIGRTLGSDEAVKNREEEGYCRNYNGCE